MLIMAIVFALAPHPAGAQRSSSEHKQAQRILNASGVKGGLVVHLGCGDGKLTAALRVNDSFMVQGLDTDAKNVEGAREHIRLLKLYGKVSIDRLRSNRLPYIENLVNLIVSEDIGTVSMDEAMRVLTPNGVAYIKNGGKWTKTVKPRPKEIDEWTHFLHDASNNAVANDSVVGPPRRLQWIGSPKWSRHHDHMGSLSAMVSAGGRVFYVIDEGPKASVLMPPKWFLVARDAFNGVILWKRPIKDWHPHLWPMKSGPTQPARRLVAVGDNLYVTLGQAASLSVLDAATGEVIRTYENSYATEEVIVSDGLLFLLVNDSPVTFSDFAPLHPDCRDERDRVALEWPWNEKERWITAVQAETGSVLWKKQRRVVPLTLVADSKRVVFYNGEKIVGLDKNSGNELWHSATIKKASPIPVSFAPTLVLYHDVVLISTGLQRLTAVSAKSGETLWTSEHSPMGHHCSEDVLVANGLAWTGATAGGRDSGVYTGRDPLTGEVKSEFPPDIRTYWFHQRCYRSKATNQYILPSRTGIEFVDIKSKSWTPHHWVRGGCAYGIMPCNGLIYTPPHSCACYMEAMLHGFCALAPDRTARQEQRETSYADGLERGPAYGKAIGTPQVSAGSDDWPTYRHDPARSSHTKNFVPIDLKHAWQKYLGGKLSSVVVADGKVFVASVETHTVYALSESSGKILWSYTVGGRVDSPPTIYQGRALFGSTDGWVYCLRASDGELIWRFRAAPVDLRLVAFEQLESVWPIHGSVLVQDDAVYCVAGRSMFVNGGMRLVRLDAKTGRKLSDTILDDRDPETGQNLQVRIQGLNMPVALPDILSSDGRNLYMRSQQFDLEGTRQTAAPTARHLFCPTGFLDDAWLHRSYWLFGTSYTSGAGGYYSAGRQTPAGRILVFDESSVYGYGRRPDYFRWVTPLEYRLFATSRNPEIVNLAGQDTSEQPRTGRRGQGRAAGAPAATAQQRKLPYAGASPAVVRGFKPQFQLPPTTTFACHWSNEIPLHVKAMVLAGKTLFIAGLPDVVDEEEAFKRTNDPGIQAQLTEQNAALEGSKGGLLLVVSASDGKKVAEYKFESTPVWDGMAAANSRLYLATKNGRILCFAGNE